ncbi:hypothetical protein [uncultured Rossellomorea sp.]|uniref:hypothetical protein n=1 Tax=uncultured Rossellomorea sp. TaxID=2837549 RepID=UPI00261725CD|nr:hypothetical protein [uncultured Rossellomorea sp.]
MSSEIKKNSIRDKRKALYKPLLIVEAYLVFTIILYIFGPWDWPTHNVLKFYLLIFLYHIAFISGYFMSMQNVSFIRLNNNFFVNEEKRNRIIQMIIRYLNIAIIVYLILAVVNAIRVVGLSGFSPVSYYNEVINGLNNPAGQYFEKFDQGSLYGGSFLSYANVLLSPLLWPVIPLSIYYFKELKFNKKVLVILAILLESSRWVATGTNKGIFDMAFVIITMLLIKNIFRKPKKTIVRKKYATWKVAIILIWPLIYFVDAISGRLGGDKINFSTINPNVGINEESFFMQIMPESFETGLIFLTSYVTQGYYAMSMALSMPYTPMFGVGNSVFLMSNFKQISGMEVFQNTYQSKVEATFGWAALNKWHTFYTWIANDVSFIGVIFIMFIIGYIYASVWKDVVINENPVAITLMALFTIMFAYISANNQVLSYPTTFTAFWGLIIYWIYSKRKLRIMDKVVDNNEK